MASSRRALSALALTFGLAVSAQHAAAQTTAAGFAPFEAWKAAVIAGDASALGKLYSTNPPAVAKVGEKAVGRLEDEWNYWSGLKSAGLTDMNPKVLEINKAPGRTDLVLRVVGVKGEDHVVAAMRQLWVQQGTVWRIAATQRSEFARDATRRLPQPARPNVSLYSEPGEAESELKAALALAKRENKRVVVVFGGNWCYDCHVLDNTFRSREFAPLVEASYVVVHINIGDDGKENNDLAARLGVALDKGVPSLGVLDPNGAVVYAQKNGEFESTVKIGPEDVRAFLEKWKPARN